MGYKVLYEADGTPSYYWEDDSPEEINKDAADLNTALNENKFSTATQMDDYWQNAYTLDPKTGEIRTDTDPVTGLAKDTPDWLKYLNTGGAAAKKVLSGDYGMPAQLASYAALGAAAKKLGLVNDGQQGIYKGYEGGIPSLVATRQQVPLGDTTNYRPGQGGRTYFTPMQYVAPSAAGTALTDQRQEAKQIATQQVPVASARSTAPSFERLPDDALRTPPDEILPGTSTGGVNDLLRQIRAPQPAYKEGDYSTQNYLRSPAYQSFMKTLPDMQTADMQQSRYGFEPGSGSMVGSRDEAYEQWAGKNLPKMAAGGGISALGGYSDGGRMLRGPGDGVSDSIPATIGGKQPARLADGEFVIPARIVSEIGNGSSEAGARKLYAMMDRIQNARKKSIKNVAANTKADKYLPR